MLSIKIENENEAFSCKCCGDWFEDTKAIDCVGGYACPECADNLERCAWCKELDIYDDMDSFEEGNSEFMRCTQCQNDGVNLFDLE